MRITVIVLTALTIAIGLSLLSNSKSEELDIPKEVHMVFKDFQKQFGKVYKTPEEYKHRLKIFYDNIIELRETKNRKDIGHNVGITKFFDLTRAEFISKYTGLRFTNTPKNYGKEKTLSKKAKESVDWRKEGIVTRVKNQGTCGSCWAFSAIASTESAYAQKEKTLIEFSEQQLVDCSTSYGNHGCNGGWMDFAFNYIEDNGIEKESDYTYIAKDQKCKVDKSKIVTKIAGFTDISKTGAALESASSERVVSVAVDADKFFSYTSGIILAKSCGISLNHGVTLVGYDHDKDSGLDYWIVKNSWGTNWGMDGYVWIEKNLQQSGAGACGIRLKSSYPHF